jgi:ribonuclease HI
VTTSQRSELRAAAYGLNHVLEWTESGVWTGREVELWTDSQYVLTMLRGGKARANPDLVAQLLAAKAMLEAAGVAVRMRHVAAHRGHVGNEMADQLSTLWRG